MTRARSVAQSLSGYLCGTHSGLLAAARIARRVDARRCRADAVAEAHRSFAASDAGETAAPGWGVWEPAPEARAVRRALADLADGPGVVDVIIFGSQARGSMTGFSDVDAVLVVDDEAADSAGKLRVLRPHVLAAQRAVLAYQPMQHHGFEVVTPRLLEEANAAVALPASALADAKCVVGRELRLRFSSERSADGAFRDVAQSVAAVHAWPRHPWAVHGLVSMFELIPTLYLQARGTTTPKWRSFEEARHEFGASWWPYDALAEIRRRWPRSARPALQHFTSAVRNPWLAVAVWRRLPEEPPREVQRLLDDRLLHGLQALVQSMEARVL